MSLKQEITSAFDKKNFQILYCGDGIPDNDWEGIDEYIRPFMQKLNQSADITTYFSCEGHKENDSAYLYFNVSEKGWDIFWSQIVPELSFQFCIPLEEKKVLLQLKWLIQISHNSEGRGIIITCHLESGEFRNWEDQKKHFWTEIQHSFLTYFS